MMGKKNLHYLLQEIKERAMILMTTAAIPHKKIHFLVTMTITKEEKGLATKYLETYMFNNQFCLAII